jgi:hypothetical protein
MDHEYFWFSYIIRLCVPMMIVCCIGAVCSVFDKTDGTIVGFGSWETGGQSLSLDVLKVCILMGLVHMGVTGCVNVSCSGKESVMWWIWYELVDFLGLW